MTELMLIVPEARPRTAEGKRLSALVRFAHQLAAVAGFELLVIPCPAEALAAPPAAKSVRARSGASRTHDTPGSGRGATVTVADAPASTAAEPASTVAEPASTVAEGASTVADGAGVS